MFAILSPNRKSYNQQLKQELTWWLHWAGSLAVASQECQATTSTDRTGPVVYMMSQRIIIITFIWIGMISAENVLHTHTHTIAAFTEEVSMLGRSDRGPWDREVNINSRSVFEQQQCGISIHSFIHICRQCWKGFSPSQKVKWMEYMMTESKNFTSDHMGW